MKTLLQHRIGDRIATIAHTTRADGDLSASVVPLDELAARRQAIIALPWRAVHQIHSDRVLAVSDAAPAADRPFADALVTDRSNLVLAVHSGDCVPVGFIHNRGLVGAAHAGWKGLEAGVLESTVRRMREQQSQSAAITAAVGPHIRASAYEFGHDDLARLARRFGDQVVAMTAEGKPALDLTAAISSELDRLDVELVASSPDCTALAADDYWSHRARQEPGRIALLAWIEHRP